MENTIVNYATLKKNINGSTRELWLRTGSDNVIVDPTKGETLTARLTSIKNSILSINPGVSTEDNISINTAGATNSTEKLYIVGAPEQSDAPQTYTNSNVYIENGELYSKGIKVETSTSNLAPTGGSYNLGNGLQLKYGYYTGSITNSQITINFTEPFPNTCLYADIMSDTASTTNPRGLYSIVSKTATNVRFGLPGVVTSGIFWIAFGY